MCTGHAGRGQTGPPPSNTHHSPKHTHPIRTTRHTHHSPPTPQYPLAKHSTSIDTLRHTPHSEKRSALPVCTRHPNTRRQQGGLGQRPAPAARRSRCAKVEQVNSCRSGRQVLPCGERPDGNLFHSAEQCMPPEARALPYSFRRAAYIAWYIPQSNTYAIIYPPRGTPCYRVVAQTPVTSRGAPLAWSPPTINGHWHWSVVTHTSTV